MVTRYKNREHKTFYTDDDGVEHDLIVSAQGIDVFNFEITSELPDMSRDEINRVAQRVSDLHWDAERSDYLLSMRDEEE